MQFEFSEEQEAIRQATRSFLEEVSTPTEVRRVIKTPEGYDADVWRALASDLELVGLLIPQAHGGSGLGFVELAAVMQEMGRALLCAPYFASAVLAPVAIALLGDEAAAARLLPDIASGLQRAALAVTETTPGVDAIETRARADGDGFRVSGRKPFVIDGFTADHLLIVARLEGEAASLGLFCVESDAAGLERTPLDTLDPTRKQAHLEFKDSKAWAVGPPTEAAQIERVLARAAVALAAEQAGGAERTLEDTVAYVQLREQFGRPIGSFQAVKHKCADMLMAAESAKAAAQYSAWAASRNAEDADAAAAVAKATCSEAYLHNAGESLQLHGGIGFTWESDAHLHLKRARSSWQLLGPPSAHRETTAVRMGLR